MQKPTIGRIVHYTLSEGDVALINELIPQVDASGRQVRNGVQEGDVFPATVVRDFGESGGTVNLQVTLDGGCLPYWATSRLPGEKPGTWSWPPRT